MPECNELCVLCLVLFISNELLFTPPTHTLGNWQSIMFSMFFFFFFKLIIFPTGVMIHKKKKGGGNIFVLLQCGLMEKSWLEKYMEGTSKHSVLKQNWRLIRQVIYWTKIGAVKLDQLASRMEGTVGFGEPWLVCEMQSACPILGRVSPETECQCVQLCKLLKLFPFAQTTLLCLSG